MLAWGGVLRDSKSTSGKYIGASTWDLWDSKTRGNEVCLRVLIYHVELIDGSAHSKTIFKAAISWNATSTRILRRVHEESLVDAGGIIPGCSEILEASARTSTYCPPGPNAYT